MYPDVILEAFDIEHFFEFHLDEFAIGIYIQVFLLRAFLWLLRAHLYLLRLSAHVFVNGAEKAFKGDGLEEIINHIQFIALKCVFPISRSQDDARFVMQRFDEVNPIQNGHLNVQKEQIDGFLFEDIKGFQGIVDGDYDHLPEAAFYMVGTIDEALEKAKKLAAEAA